MFEVEAGKGVPQDVSLPVFEAGSVSQPLPEACPVEGGDEGVVGHLVVFEFGGSSTKWDGSGSARFAGVAFDVDDAFLAVDVSPVQSPDFSRSDAAPQHEPNGGCHGAEIRGFCGSHEGSDLSGGEDFNAFFVYGWDFDSFDGVDGAPALPLSVGKDAVEDGSRFAEDVGAVSELFRQHFLTLDVGDGSQGDAAPVVVVDHAVGEGAQIGSCAGASVGSGFQTGLYGLKEGYRLFCRADAVDAGSDDAAVG